MVLKVYCDVCGKEITLVGQTPGAAYTDEGVGRMISLKVDEMAWDSVELCKDHAEEFLAYWKSFQTLEVTEDSEK